MSLMSIVSKFICSGNIFIKQFFFQRAVTMIPAHDSPVAAMAFNSAGTKLSTASEKASLKQNYSAVSRVGDYKKKM